MKASYLSPLPRVLLAAVIVLVFFCIAWFIQLNQTPLHWDFAGNVLNTLDYQNFIENKSWVKLFTYYRFYYPPLVFILMAFFSTVFGLSALSIFLFNSLLLCLLFFATWKFCQWFLKDELSGAASIVLLLSLFVSGQVLNVKFWELMLDAPALIFTLISYYVLVYCLHKNEFGYREAFVFSGIVSFAFLTKWTTMMYLMVPLVVLVLQSLRKRNYLPLGLFAGATSLFAGAWYIYHGGQLWEQVSFYASQYGKLRGDPGGLDGVLFYLSGFWLVSRWFLGFVIAGLFIVAARLRALTIEIQTRWAWWIVIPLSLVVSLVLLLGVFSNNDPTFRYVFPTFVIVYWWIHMGLNRILDLPLRRIMNILVICFSLLRLAMYLPTPDMRPYVIAQWQKDYAGAPSQSLAYFFEDDMSMFHYNNIALFHRQLARGGDVWFANSFEDPSAVFTCRLPRPPMQIAVYRNSQGSEVPIYGRVSFFQTCPKEITDQYVVTRVYENHPETLTILTRATAAE